MLFAARLNEIAAQVAEYQAEIARLQALISDQQQHAQQIQSAEQAAESALSQIDTALSMINAIAPDQLAVFKAAVDAKFSAEAIAELPPVIDSEPEDQIETLEKLYNDDEVEGTEPEAETETTTTVDVEVILEVEGEVSEAPEITNGDGFLTYDELVKLSRPTLVKLAKGCIDKPQHKSVAELAIALAEKGISQTDALLTSLKK